MAYVHVDIDLDEFDSDEIIKEIISRLQKGAYRGLTQSQKTKLGAALNTTTAPDGIKIQSLEDVQKFELLCYAFNKYSLLDLEQIISV